ncbi:putative mitochondrial protein [Dendrobium catenatum]|uniref:Putative mitochondrial protein n=1 Tax=Dendrobium catenatum TaxID=906689 RepID=A0A2I0VDS8_9ASPA|nr:putative mitochondrial protein [Dendrobium catenatum]
MMDCKPALSPLSTKILVPSHDSQLYPHPHLYKQLVGSLQYVTITRPDVAYAVNYLCQHMHQPYILHFQHLQRVFRYLKGTIHYVFPIFNSTLELRAYADSDWAANVQDRRSITGCCTFLGDNLISWSVKKQPTVARSSTEAEYRALATLASDILWLRQLLTDFLDNFLQILKSPLVNLHLSSVTMYQQ